MIVCHCHGVTDRVVDAFVSVGMSTTDQLAAVCGAGSDCGGCVDRLAAILEAADRVDDVLAQAS